MGQLVDIQDLATRTVQPLSLSDPSRVSMSPSCTGPFTAQMLESLVSLVNPHAPVCTVLQTRTAWHFGYAGQYGSLYVTLVHGGSNLADSRIPFLMVMFCGGFVV